MQKNILHISRVKMCGKNSLVPPPGTPPKKRGFSTIIFGPRFPAEGRRRLVFFRPKTRFLAQKLTIFQCFCKTIFLQKFFPATRTHFYHRWPGNSSCCANWAEPNNIFFYHFIFTTFSLFLLDQLLAWRISTNTLISHQPRNPHTKNF